MDVIIERTCGLDVHKDSITACIMTSEGKEVRTFSTKTVFLLELMTGLRNKDAVYDGGYKCLLETSRQPIGS
jgi:hypothetical protein